MKTEEAKTAGLKNGGDESTQGLIQSWAPITTRLLEGRSADSSSWYVLDHVEEEANFVSNLRHELRDNGYLSLLSSSKTQGDVQANRMLSLLQGSGLLHHDTSPETVATSVRGDKSTFISRQLRQTRHFHIEFPHLFRLIDKIETTAARHLAHCMEFDWNLTSVQLAEYPGDGSSGYPRHCDRQGNICRHEETTKHKRNDDDDDNDTNNTNNSNNHHNAYAGEKKSERLLTAVYYLTPDDWDLKKDGGCLRLYVDDNATKIGNSNAGTFVDVAPYQNRLVVFRSDGVEHEVRPSLKRPRLALTIWLYGKLKEVTTTRDTNSGETRDTTKASQGAPTAKHGDVTQPTSGPPPLAIQNHIQEKHDLPTIFVSCAAYRDSEIGPTLRNLAAMATNPERVFVGLCLQLDLQEDAHISNSIPTNDPWYQSNVRWISLEARHALGPCYARALCQSLFRGEDYFLQIDSHMRFRKHWDTYLIEQLENLIVAPSKTNDKVMLTAYPVGYQLPNNIPNETRGTLLVPWKFDENGILRQRGRLLHPQPTPTPKSCLLYAAGFNFSRSAVLQDCPYDESLHHLFFGEELSMAVRLYTKGYDLYAPCESVCYHLWSRGHRPTHSPMRQDSTNQKWHEQRKKESLQVVWRQLLGTAERGRISLGSVRTALQFASALGVDFETRTILHEHDQLGVVQGVEFVDDAAVLCAPESFQGKIQSLDQNAQDLIASFLRQM